MESRPGSKRTCRWSVWTLLWGVFIGAPVSAGPLDVSHDFVFSTTDQGMWQRGSGNAVNESFTLEVINDTVPRKVLGRLDSVTVLEGLGPPPPPPSAACLGCAAAYAAYQVKLALCRNKGYSTSQCKSGLSVKDGARVVSVGHVRAGYKGDLTVGGGGVDVTYPTRATLAARTLEAGADRTVELSLSEQAGEPDMKTRFSDIDLALKRYIDMAAKVDLTAFNMGSGGNRDVLDFDTGYFEDELVGAHIDSNEGLTLRLPDVVTGGPLPGTYRTVISDPTVSVPVGEGIGTNIPVPGAASAAGLTGPLKLLVGFPMADVQLWVPELDTDGPSAVNPLAGGGKEIINRTDVGGPRVGNRAADLVLLGAGASNLPNEFGKFDLDVDVLSLFAGAPLGATAGVPLAASLEANVLDADLGAFFGLEQEFKFAPRLYADLQFSEPVEIAGVGIVEQYRLYAGETLALIDPPEGLSITPTYGLDNLFTNLTHLTASVTFTEAFLQLVLSGLVPSALDIDFDLALLEQAFPLSDPILLGQVGSADPFMLEGFQTFAGTALQLADITSGGGGGAELGEPGAYALLAAALAIWGWTFVRAGSVDGPRSRGRA